jgi:hypothetical protein
MRLGSDEKCLNCRARSVFRSVNICADTERAMSSSIVRPGSEMFHQVTASSSAKDRVFRGVQGVAVA